MRQSLYTDAVKAQYLPKIIKLGPGLYGAAFTLMKTLPARKILENAVKGGMIGERTVVVETTSGTFGLGLAMECALRNIPLVLVSDPVIDDRLRNRLEDLGAQVDIVERPAPTGGFQEARLKRLEEIMDELPDHFCPRQYDNPDNPHSYAEVAELILENIGPINCLVGPVGSGGSMCGTSTYIRRLLPDMKAIGVDTFGSILFGLKPGERQLRGLGNGILPKNLDHRVFDEVHWVTRDLAYRSTRVLHQSHALYMGPTSGASYQVAQWNSDQGSGGATVALLPDEGYRYENIYADVRNARRNTRKQADLGSAPLKVEHPYMAAPEWSYMKWNRRSLSEVFN